MPILKVKNENGTWSEIGGTSVVVGGGSSGDTANCITGLSSSGTIITYTRGNGSTGTITTQDTVYTHPTTAGNKHIPSAGSTNNYLKYSSAGTATWATGFGIAGGGTGSVILGDLASKTSSAGNTASGSYSITAGRLNTATQTGAIAMGYSSDATASYAVALGYNAAASGSYAVALSESKATGTNSFAAAGGEANGQYSSAFGYSSYAIGNYSTAVCAANANGEYSFAQGFGSNSQGSHSTALGNFALAEGDYQVALGRYNAGTAGPTSLNDTTGALLIVGNGTSASARNNVLNLQTAGNMWLKGEYKTTGADYAEYFEWSDGNPNKEDRRGRFVTIDVDDKIRYATSEDDYILGIVSSAPSVVGDSYDDSWHGKYLKDIYGSLITETVEVEESIDEQTGRVIPAHTDVRFVMNPQYDANEEYIPRKDRLEWSAIGMMGKLVVDDDGTCEVNGYASVGENGIATKGTKSNGYRVISRIDENHIRVIFK